VARARNDSHMLSWVTELTDCEHPRMCEAIPGIGPMTDSEPLLAPRESPEPDTLHDRIMPGLTSAHLAADQPQQPAREPSDKLCCGAAAGSSIQSSNCFAAIGAVSRRAGAPRIKLLLPEARIHKKR